ncbi:hypothetical protein A2W14_00365 [Candidatus Gottesmanbacteria bacterium RBG_16_37_8]|uniref:SD-repeat containing protein B domain-containing protein n=1 Tax=Candidatus Gottesmanbacteria bacterium RBG_16_37_8 TaxID=1798371 RepID=A0A1F5YSY4_9BACT|nr:MAG: hypothetical protein A2W14_00365 [Candidatus Gottesmanbacteria bacterium RBG_16_37_8]
MNDEPQINVNQTTQETLPETKQTPNVLNFLKTKKALFIIGGFILLLILSSFLFLSPKQQNENQPTKPKLSKIWEITLSFDQKTQKLSLKKINIKEGNVTSSNFGLSPYKLYVLDKDNKKLFQTDIHITEEILYMIDTVPEGSSSAIPENLEPLESVVYAPYLKEATKIEIYKKDEKVLEISPPKNSSFNLIDKAFAQTNNVCANSLNLVFVSDGYSSEATFNNNVQQVIGKFVSLYPYSENPKIMDFSRAIYNTTSLGCKSGTQFNCNKDYCPCLSQAEPLVRNIVFTKYPELQGVDSDHLKFIILVDADMSRDGVLGVAKGLGGSIGAFETHYQLLKVCAHEILGHAAGYLYDRYIYSSGANSILKTTKTESNCSANSAGASFWSQIPGAGAYPGCTSNYLYAPFPRDCDDPNAGSKQTMMSMARCASAKFDAVEEAWLKNNIVSKYQVCDSSVIPSTTTTEPGQTTTTTISQSDIPYIKGVVFIDSNNNNSFDFGETKVTSARVTLTQTNGSYLRTIDSDLSGGYSFAKINSGNYELKVEAGNGIGTVTGIAITSSSALEINIPLPAGTVTATTSTTTTTSAGGLTTTTTTLPYFRMGTPTPTPRIYQTANCVPDPATCKSGVNAIQQCALKCTIK